MSYKSVTTKNGFVSLLTNGMYESQGIKPTIHLDSAKVYTKREHVPNDGIILPCIVNTEKTFTTGDNFSRFVMVSPTGQFVSTKDMLQFADKIEDAHIFNDRYAIPDGLFAVPVDVDHRIIIKLIKGHPNEK